MVLGEALAVFSAFLSTARESVRKYISEDFSSVEIGYFTQVWGIIMLLPLALWRFSVSGFPFSPELVGTVIIAGGVVVSSTYLYVEAMRLTDISVTEPIRKTTPLFVAFLEPFFLGIKFQLALVGGAILGTLGAWVLVSDGGLLQPFSETSRKGVFYSVLVALIFAIWAIALRFGATSSDPIVFMYLIYISGLIGFGLWQYSRPGRISLSTYFRKDVVALGFITAFSSLVGIFVLTFLSASEATIIKQTSAIFGVLIGGRFFNEKGLLRKFIGSMIIIAAVILVI